jgi:hypothetical protein
MYAIDPTPSMIAQKIILANTANKPGCACHRLLTIFAASGRTALSRRTSPKLEASGTIPARPNDSPLKRSLSAIRGRMPLRRNAVKAAGFHFMGNWENHNE